MTINYLAIILLTIVSFVIGWVWFSKPFFGRIWMRLHGMNKLTPEEKDMMMYDGKGLMFTEFILTLVLNYILYLVIIESVTLNSALMTTTFLWLGFVLPTNISTVIWGSDGKKGAVLKVAISSVYRLIMMLIAAWAFFIWV